MRGPLAWGGSRWCSARREQGVDCSGSLEAPFLSNTIAPSEAVTPKNLRRHLRLSQLTTCTRRGMSRLCTSAHAGKWVRKGVHDGGCGHLSSGRFGEGAGSKRGVRKHLVLLPRVRVHGKASKGAHEAFYSRVQASGSNEARAYLVETLAKIAYMCSVLKYPVQGWRTK